MASDDGGDDSDDIALDRETWEICFHDLLEKSPEFAERLARILFWLRYAVQNGPEGIAEADRSLTEGIKFAYLYTDAHRMAFELFLLYIDGHLEVPDEPKRLIGEAVARGAANAKKFRKRDRSKK